MGGSGQSRFREIKLNNPQARLSKEARANLKEEFDRLQEGMVS